MVLIIIGMVLLGAVFGPAGGKSGVNQLVGIARKPATWLLAASVIFGLLLIREAYDILAATPAMHSRLYQVVRMVIAIGSGFTGAGILGSLEISGNWQTITVKAGGPFALIVFFYSVDPMI